MNKSLGTGFTSAQGPVLALGPVLSSQCNGLPSSSTRLFPRSQARSVIELTVTPPSSPSMQ